MNKCFEIHEHIPYIKKRYQRLALVSLQRHLDKLEPNDTETLTVSCDWFLWQKCLKKGMHCIYFESGLLHWTDNNSLDTDLLLRANDWVYVKGEDVTRFKDVSLGRLFNSEIAFFIVNYIRIERSLRVLVEKYKPTELFLYDYRTEFGFLDTYTNKAIVSSVASEFGVKIRDMYDPPSPYDADLAVDPVHGDFMKGTPKRKIVRGIFWRLLAVVSRLSNFSRTERDKILFLVGSKAIFSLVHSFCSVKILPVFLSQHFPKKMKFLFDSLRKGILLETSPLVLLNENENKKFRNIKLSLEKAWFTPAKGIEEAIRHYVRVNILDKNRLYEMAMQVKGAQHTIDRLKPKRVFIDGVRNPPQAIYAELAYQRKIPVDYIWHSIITLNYKFENLGCDQRARSFVTRCLTWGKTNEDWLDNIGADTLKVRSGSPNNDYFLDLSSMSGQKQNRGNVLVLQYTPESSDIKRLNANQYSYYVNVVRTLRDMGYSNIRVKLHPGIMRKEYYEKIAEFYGLDCEVYRLESFKDCIEWADFVIGPAITGGMLEVLASGKDYYAFLLEPHSFDMRYFAKVRLHTDVASLRSALENNEYVDRKTVLNEFCSFDEIPNTSKRIWEILENDLS